MKKVSIIFSVFAANALVIATGIYYFYLHLKSEDLVSLSQYFAYSTVAYFNPFMRPSLLFYILGSFLIGISLIAAISLRNNRLIDSIIEEKRFIYFFVCGITALIMLCFIQTWAILLIQIALWATALMIIRYCDRLGSLARKFYDFSVIPKIVLLLSIVFIFFIFLPQILNTPNIMNAFFRIPEMYNIGKVYESDEFGNKVSYKYYKHRKRQPDAYVDTTTIINSLGLLKGYEYVDILNYEDWKSNSACLAVRADDEVLVNFIDTYTREVVRPAPGAFWKPHVYFNFPALLYYSENRLCIIPPVGAPDYIHSSATYVRNKLGEIGIDASSILDSYIPREQGQSGAGIAPPRYARRSQLKEYDFLDAAIKKSYLKTSALERAHIANQRGQIKHHIYYLFPSYEYLMGKPLDKIIIQYGVGLTLFLSAAGKVVQFFGSEPTYGGALKFLASFYFIGFAVCLVSLGLIFKDVRFTSLAALILILNNLMRGHIIGLIAPGIYELRFFLDMPAVYLLYRYGVTKKNVFLWWLVSALFLALLNNFEFGLFLSVSFLGALFIYRLMEQSDTPGPAFFVVGSVGIGLAYYVFSIPAESMGSYFLIGLFSVRIPSYDIGYLMVVFAIYILMFLHMRGSNSPLAYPFLATAFYSQTILCFYVWCGLSNHFDILFSRLALPPFFYFVFLLKEKIDSELKKNIIYCLAAAVLIVIINTQYNHYKNSVKQFNDTFKHHQVYFWDKFGTNINSTMNPDFFEPAVILINKYLPDRKDLYMISQYDFLLTYLAKKYSGMPHFDITGNIVSAQDIEQAVDRLRQDKPEYIFVDSDINTPYELSILWSDWGPQVYAEGRWHILALNSIRTIYKAVLNDYDLVDRGQLISVYQLKEKSAAKICQSNLDNTDCSAFH